jgi:cellulose synthase/poly-beta-1,6-N-acetylglucosamine synthase-like glycosyltransferase
MILFDATVILLAIAGALLFVPVVVLFIEVVASFGKVRTENAPSSRPRIAVLVPAHDEALIIGATIASIMPELAAGDRLLVVADNCTDDTAVIARTAGADVIERSDPVRRGKGFALDFGVRHLAGDAPDVVVIIDADCRPDVGCLARIAALAAATGRPVQAHYDLLPPKGVQSLYLSMATFAWRVKNYARPLGARRLGLSCQLMGTGMAFPWPLLSGYNLATSEIVEDLVYGLELARAGHPPLFCPQAQVMSEFPMVVEGQQTQRTRWESGHLSTIAGYIPGLLMDALRRGDWVLLALALDAAVPPVAFLALLVAAYTLLALLAAILGGGLTVLGLAFAIALLFAGALLLAWWRVGRDVVSISELMLAPGYILSKIGLYGRVLIGRKVGWVRSKRDTH